MPPITNRYSGRYHPFSRPLTLHTLFPAERPICLPHSLYTIHPIDCDLSSVNPPRPLLPPKTAVLTASEYFSAQEILYPNKVYEKPKGEVGRTDPKRIGYSLIAALKWPTEVYKEVQVGYSSHAPILSSIMVRPNCTSLLAKSYLWLHLQIRHRTIWIPFIRAYVIFFCSMLSSFKFNIDRFMIHILTCGIMQPTGSLQISSVCILKTKSMPSLSNKNSYVS
jgi:hypothetical protein